MRSNMFANIENKFKNLSEEAITGFAVVSLQQMFDALSGFPQEQLFFIALSGANLGVSGDGKLNEKEKKLIDNVFGPMWNGDMKDIYNYFNYETIEQNYKLVETAVQMGNSFAMPFLHYILSFAYIDGVFEDEVAKRLDGLFGMNLLAEFIQSGMESVPEPEIQLSGLEAEIVKLLEADDSLMSLNNILKHFSGRSKSDVQAALDSLCEKGVLYCVNSMVGNMYGLT